MEQVPQADGPPVPEWSVEQATRERRDDDRVVVAEPRAPSPVPFAVPERLTVVDSTNRYLVGLVRTGLGDGSEVPEGYGVVADYQHEGRGRLQRRWEAPPGTAVLCSILLKPDLGLGQLHLAPWAVALAAVRACRATAGVELSLKWPNDLVTAGPAGPGQPGPRPGEQGRKVAGLLAEIVAPGAPGAAGAVVVGIGINVNWPAGWPPADAKDPELAAIARRATSLNRIAGHSIDRDELVRQLLTSTGEASALLASSQGRRALASQYRRACATIGREVRVELGDETVAGIALDVDEAGCLLVSTGACIRTISAGDVVHLR